MIGISKQGVHDMLNRKMRQKDLHNQVLKLVYKIRSQHPTMGIRTMYYKLGDIGMGRDKFEALCRQADLILKKKKNYRKTTDSQGVTRFDNLLTGLEITQANQVWQSDITYYEVKGKFQYITLIQDAYTRKIVGHSASTSLATEHTTLRALKRAIKNRGTAALKDLIFHSDGGGQYYQKEFIGLLSKHGIKSSMAESCYENAMAESLNGVIKNKYLDHMSIDSYEQLRQALDRIVRLYNHDKPHSALNRMTPVEFEQSIVVLESQVEATMRKSIDANARKNEASSHILSGQVKAQNQNIISANVE